MIPDHSELDRSVVRHRVNFSMMPHSHKVLWENFLHAEYFLVIIANHLNAPDTYEA
jgi:hypothetical protein